MNQQLDNEANINEIDQTSSGRELAQQKHLETLSESIREEVAKIEEYARKTVKHALLAGKLLCEAKAKVGHGSWLAWFEKQTFNFAEVTAQRYMRLWRGWPQLQEQLLEQGNPSRLTELSIDSALQLLSNPSKLKSSASSRLKLLDSNLANKQNGSELILQVQVHYIEEVPTAAGLLKAAQAVLGCAEVYHQSKLVDTSRNQTCDFTASLETDSLWRGKVFVSPLRDERSLQKVSQELCLAFANNSVSEAILLVPTQVDAPWYRRFRECARVHLAKPDDETGLDWTESLTAIYLGDRQELFLEVFKLIGDGYLPYRTRTASTR